MNTFKGDVPEFGVKDIDMMECPSCAAKGFEDSAVKDFTNSPYGEQNERIFLDLWSCTSCGTVIRPPKEKRRFESPLMFFQ